MAPRYTAYGLNIESQIPLPELLRAENASNVCPDVTIHYGDVPDVLAAPLGQGVAWQAAPGEFLLRVHGVGNYLVVEGREIRVEPAPASRADDVRGFLLGSVMGALLHQRGIATWHASVVQTQKGAVLFMGRSGYGKSTLLAAFLHRGYAMLADDKAGIVLGDNGHPLALPGFPISRLWADAVAHLGYSAEDLQRHRTSMEKYLLPVDRFCNRPLPVYAAYELSPDNGEEIRLEPVGSVERFEVIAHSTYRQRCVRALGQDQGHFKVASAIANTVRVRRLIRPAEPFLLDELVAKVEEDLDRGEDLR